MVPSRYGAREELVELARTAGEFEGTSLELIPMVGPFEPWAVQLMADMSAAAQRPLNWNVMAGTAGNLADCEKKLDAGSYAAAHGGRVIALTVPMSFPLRLSFRSGFILDAMPSWEGPMLLPLEQKLALFRDADARTRLNDAAQSESNPMRALADWRRMRIFDVFAAENEQYRGKTVGEIADAEGRDPWEVLCAIALADDLNTGFGTEPMPASDDDWNARLQIWRDHRALIGASDAGAHLDLFSTANYATHLLGPAVRERNLLPLEEAVQMITETPAQVYGLRERGALKEGWKADVVVFDPDTVAPHPVEMRYDLPGGAGRLYGESAGIEQVLVNGTAIVRDGVLTDARAGKLLRSGTDTTNPSMG
jgi:N-acyl-D-aspartate/D-glutamate deacylase